VTLAKIANATFNSRVLGSSPTGAGSDYIELTMGNGVQIAGTTLRTLEQMSVTSDGSGLKLVADQTSPGMELYYGTEGGSKQWVSAVSGDWVAKGWIVFDGTGTVAIKKSYNVSSLTDVGTGDWRVNWDADFDSADYAVAIGQKGQNATERI